MRGTRAWYPPDQGRARGCQRVSKPLVTPFQGGTLRFQTFRNPLPRGYLYQTQGIPCQGGARHSVVPPTKGVPDPPPPVREEPCRRLAPMAAQRSARGRHRRHKHTRARTLWMVNSNAPEGALTPTGVLPRELSGGGSLSKKRYVLADWHTHKGVGTPT